MEPRSVAVRYGDEELHEFARRQLRSSVVAIVVVALPIVSLLTWSELRRSGSALDILQTPILIALLSVFAVAVTWHLTVTPRRIARGLIETYGGRDVQVAWDDEAMTLTAPRITARQAWRDVRRVIETTRLLVLVVGKDVVLVLPKRDLGAHTAELRRLAEARTGRA